MRGTSRTARGCEAIEAAGLEAVQADPDRLGTVLGALEGVSVVCWLMGSADGQGAADVHGPRWRAMLERLVDTPVRGVVYEATGAAAPELLEEGAAHARAAANTFQMPVEVVEADPADHAAWLAAILAAVRVILGA